MTTAKASRAKTQSSSPSEATEEAQTDDYAQRFDLLRLIYYHDDARQFNVFMHNATTFSTILLGSLVAGTFISDHLGPFAPYFGLAVAILQSVDFVVDFQSKANMHSAEKAIYNELFTRLSFDRSAANIHKIENEKLVNFERGSEKYTPFWGVDAVAWNSAYSQLTGSTDFEADELFPINFIEMALRHLVRFSPSYFREKKKRAQRIKHGKRVALYYVIAACTWLFLGAVTALISWEAWISNSALSMPARVAILAVGITLCVGLFGKGIDVMFRILRFTIIGGE